MLKGNGCDGATAAPADPRWLRHHHRLQADSLLSSRQIKHVDVKHVLTSKQFWTKISIDVKNFFDVKKILDRHRLQADDLFLIKTDI